MSLGAAVGGLVAAITGAAITVATGAEAVVVAGATGKQIFAWGAAVYNVFVSTIAPILGMELEPIEIEP